MTTNKTQTSKKTKNTKPITPDPHFQEALDPVFALLDQKIENLRQRTDHIVTTHHDHTLSQRETAQDHKQLLHDYKLQLKELESNLQYLSHKTDLKLREMQNVIDKMGGDLEVRVQDIHFKCREEIFGLTRRVEAIEKILF